MSRNIRTNFLTDKSTFGNSTMPIGAIVPIFKATDDKVTDNGVVTSIGAVGGGALTGGTGYVTDSAPSSPGAPTTPIDFEIATSGFQEGTDLVNIPNHPFIEGDKLTVIATDQAPTKCKLGASIQSITVNNAGTGYTSAPNVQVTDSGTGPLVQGSFAATIDTSTGTVTGITVIDGGEGYQFPVVTLTGGGGNDDATATPVLATGGVGGIDLDKGFEFYVDVVDSNNIRFSRSNSEAASGTKYYNITNVGTNGTVRVASSTGFGLRVGVIANLAGNVTAATLKNAGYGYKNGEVVYISQPGSSGTARIEIANTISPTIDEPDVQYEGWLYCDGGEYKADEFPLLYQVIENKYGGLGATYDPDDFGSASTITFNVPDYKARKLVGAGGGVSGGGSPVSGNVISTVGQTGGRWFFSKTQQEALFDIGNIVISGYTNVTEFVGGSLTGEVTIQIGPLIDKMITSVPEHDHAIMTSTASQSSAFEGNSFPVDTFLASYKDSTGGVLFFLPSGGSPLFHSHGIVDYIITDPTLSTFGNVSGIGETIDVIITAGDIYDEVGGTRINIPGHDLATGYKIRVKSNEQTTECTFDYKGVFVTMSTNTEWYVIVIDDDNFYLNRTKYEAKKGEALSATTNGSTGDITLELMYKFAGNLPADTVTVIQQPNDTVWDIDNTYTIGGKTITNPGGSLTKTEVVAEANTAGSYTVPAPTAEQVPIVGVNGFLGGGGGGGATTDVIGQPGQPSYYSFTYSGSTIVISSEGGDGGADGDSGGAGGEGGRCVLSASSGGGTSTSVNVNSNGTYSIAGLDIEITSYQEGNDGQDGASDSGGNGGASVLLGGAGGDGAQTLYEGENDVTQSFNTPSQSFFTYTKPSTWPLSNLRAIIKGGGGGSGGTGSSNYFAGDGGAGKRLVVDIDTTQASLRVYVGGGGQHPTNIDLNPGGGYSFAGGAGSPDGFSPGGTGGNGTGGGAGGGGGGSSSIGTSVQILAGAGGGGGGGAGGDANQGSDQNGQENANDGAVNLSTVFAGPGDPGQNSVCSGGGGGGGGGGVGSGNGIGGGGGAGNGSNAVRDGFGAQRGRSAYKGSGSGGTCTLVSQSGDAANGTNVGSAGNMADGGAGSVEFIATENQTFLGFGGGGGGSGSYFQFQFDISSINAGTLVVGDGGNNGGQDGVGRVGYQITETLDDDITTSVTSGLFDSASPQVDYVESGTGAGVNGGFASIDSEKYLRYFGNEAVRYARTIGIDCSAGNSKSSPINTVKIRVIRGNGSNGGEKPNEPLELYASNDNATSFAKIGTISSQNGPTTWTIVDIPLPNAYRVANVIFEVRQTRSGSGNPNLDNYGIDYVAFAHDEVEETITTYPSGKADLGIEFVTERIEPQGDPLNSAGLEVNEGTFTLSSAVKLNVDSSLQPDIDIPLLTRYHLVKYMIRAY